MLFLRNVYDVVDFLAFNKIVQIEFVHKNLGGSIFYDSGKSTLRGEESSRGVVTACPVPFWKSAAEFNPDTALDWQLAILLTLQKSKIMTEFFFCKHVKQWYQTSYI
jgi:hypothetical protein